MNKASIATKRKKYSALANGLFKNELTPEEVSLAVAKLKAQKKK